MVIRGFLPIPSPLLVYNRLLVEVLLKSAPVVEGSRASSPVEQVTKMTVLNREQGLNPHMPWRVKLGMSMLNFLKITVFQSLADLKRKTGSLCNKGTPQPWVYGPIR